MAKVEIAALGCLVSPRLRRLVTELACPLDARRLVAFRFRCRLVPLVAHFVPLARFRGGVTGTVVGSGASWPLSFFSGFSGWLVIDRIV